MDRVRMAVRGSEDNPAMALRWAAYGELMKAATDLKVKLYESSDYNGIIQAMVSGQVDIATVAGGSYANLHAQIGDLAVPILSVRDAEGALGYYSALIVKADSPYKSLADLKGRSLGYVDLNSTSGYLYPRAKLREDGVDPDTYFGKISFAGGHTQAVMALENGQFDATIVQIGGGTPETGFTTGALYTMARRGVIEVDDFRVLWVVGPIPNSAVVVRTDRPQSFIDSVRGAMASIAYDDPGLWTDIGQPDGATFAAVDATHYAVMARLRDEEVASRRRNAGQ
jgi:phosphonate transport system substrate-binding protein